MFIWTGRSSGNCSSVLCAFSFSVVDRKFLCRWYSSDVLLSYFTLLHDVCS